MHKLIVYSGFPALMAASLVEQHAQGAMGAEGAQHDAGEAEKTCKEEGESV